MRPVAVLLALLLIFFFLARLLPAGWVLPLYCLFTAGGIAYGYWEWKEIGRRREVLQRDLERRGDLGHLFAETEEEAGLDE